MRQSPLRSVGGRQELGQMAAMGGGQRLRAALDQRLLPRGELAVQGQEKLEKAPRKLVARIEDRRARC